HAAVVDEDPFFSRRTQELFVASSRPMPLLAAAARGIDDDRHARARREIDRAAAIDADESIRNALGIRHLRSMEPARAGARSPPGRSTRHHATAMAASRPDVAIFS